MTTTLNNEGTVPMNMDHARSTEARVFELELRGFDGADSATDDRIVWVSASDRQAVMDQLSEAGLLRRAMHYPAQHPKVVAVRPIEAAPDRADFALPGDLEGLVARVDEVLERKVTAPSGPSVGFGR